jgi:hypothetical protein
MSELTKKSNRLAVLAFGTELIADRYEKRVAYAKKFQQPIVTMSTDELDSLCARLRELTVPVREMRDLLLKVRSSSSESLDLRFPVADPAMSPTGDNAA